MRLTWFSKKTSTPCASPVLSAITRLTNAFVTSVHRPVASARGITVLCEPLLALDGHAKPTHVPHATHASRPPYGTLLIASGTAAVCQPSRVAAADNTRVSAVAGNGAIG